MWIARPGEWSAIPCSGRGPRRAARPAPAPAEHQPTPRSWPTPLPTAKPTLAPTKSADKPTSPPATNCDPSYPPVCIPPKPPDLDCGDIPYRRFQVLPPDPHGFDGDNAGIFILEGGRVGINKNNPTYPLDVNGFLRADTLLGDGSKLTGLTSDGHSLDAADGSPQDVVYVDNDGRVGVGSTSYSTGL